MNNNLTKDEELYIEQMNNWIEEQQMIEKQLNDTIEYHVFLAESNRKQFSLHQERMVLAFKYFEQWKADHGI